MLYPNFDNQSSLSTNHLEAGEHVGGKANRLKHKPIDFTVPLLGAAAELRVLWTDEQGAVAPTSPLVTLPTLGLFSQRASLGALAEQGAAARASRAKVWSEKQNDVHYS